MSETTQESLIVESRVKALVAEEECRSDGELADAISEKVRTMVENACERAKANGRTTVRPCDL